MPADTGDYFLWMAIACAALFLATLGYAAIQDHLADRNKR